VPHDVEWVVVEVLRFVQDDIRARGCVRGERSPSLFGKSGGEPPHSKGARVGRPPVRGNTLFSQNKSGAEPEKKPHP
jgi:hypothetical protein